MGCGRGGEGRELQNIFSTPMEVAPSRSKRVAHGFFSWKLHCSISALSHPPCMGILPRKNF
jgi:hypothetical protein